MLGILIAGAIGFSSVAVAETANNQEIFDIINKAEGEGAVTKPEPVKANVSASNKLDESAESTSKLVFASDEAIADAKEYTGMQQQLKKLQVQLQIAQTKNDLLNAQNASDLDKYKKEITMLKLDLEDAQSTIQSLQNQNGSLQSEVAGLRSQLNGLASEEAKSEKLSDVHLLRVTGFGDNLKAHVYYMNDMFILKPGQEIGGGINLEHVTPEYAVVSNGEVKKKLRITTSERAYERSVTFKDNADDLIGSTPFPAM